MAEPEIGLDPVKDLLSTPFDVCFDGLLERLSEHKGLFDTELRAGRHTSLQDFIEKVTQNKGHREQSMQENEVRRYLEDTKKVRDRKGSTQKYSPSLLRADNERGFFRKVSVTGSNHQSSRRISTKLRKPKALVIVLGSNLNKHTFYGKLSCGQQSQDLCTTAIPKLSLVDLFCGLKVGRSPLHVYYPQPL